MEDRRLLTIDFYFETTEGISFERDAGPNGTDLWVVPPNSELEFLAYARSSEPLAAGGFQLNFRESDPALDLFSKGSLTLDEVLAGVTSDVNTAVWPNALGLLDTQAAPPDQPSYVIAGGNTNFVPFIASLNPPFTRLLTTIHLTTGSQTGDFLVNINEGDPAAPDRTTVLMGTQGVPISDYGSMTVRVIDNFPPAATDDTASTPEDTAVTIPVLANDTDPDGDTLSLSAVADPAHGTATIVGSQVQYTPDANYHGTDTFTYTVSDGTDTAMGTVMVTITPVADAPTPVNDNPTTLEDMAVTVDVLANDSDPDGDALTITAVSTPANGTASIVANRIMYTPNANHNGADTFTYTVSDGALTGMATVNVTILAVNDVPVANDDEAVAAPDTPVTIDVLANDTDLDGDTLTISNVTTPANGSAQVVAGEIRYTPNAGFSGQDMFQYTVNDGNGGTDTAQVVVIVDIGQPPVGVNDTRNGNEDQPLVISTATLLANDTDPDPGDVLSFVSATNGTNGTVTDNMDGTITYLGNLNYNGPDSFSYTLRDRAGNTATATVSITLAPVNDAPVAVNDTRTMEEDTTDTFNPAANDTDVDGDSLTVTQVQNAQNGMAVRNANGTVSFTPTVGHNGPASYQYTVSDGRGGTAVGTVNITVVAQNDPPVAGNDTATTNEDTPVTIDVLANDSDPDGNPLTISILSATNGTAVVSNNAVSYTPAANFHGTAMVRYQLSDGIELSNIATVTITVNSVNDPPVASDDIAGTNENTPVLISVLANDSDADGDTLTLVSATNGAQGSTQIVGNQIRYTPNPGANGDDSFTYTIADGNGAQATASVNVRITDVNSPPIARNDSATGDEDTVINVDVLANDSDPDGDEVIISVVSVTNGTVAINDNGTASLADDSLDFTPAANFSGSAQVLYRLSDGITNSNIAIVNITVNAVNDNPTAVDDSFVAIRNSISNIFDVLGNDTDAPDVGEILTITQVSTPSAGGTVSTNGDVVFYTPAAGFAGSETFQYTITDGHGGTATATANVTVAASQYFRAGNDLVFLGSEGRDRIIVQPLTFDNLNIMVRTDTSNFGPLPLGPQGRLIIMGFGGNDNITLSGSLRADVTVDGGAGNDRIAGAGRGDILMGGAGNDEILGGEGDNWMDGGAGNDRITGRSGNETLIGGTGNDILLGSSGDDTMMGGDGHDQLSGGGGKDLLDGGDGDDILLGGSGDDLLTGRDGNDQVKGEEGDDFLIGGQGVDAVNGGQDQDALFGGETTADDAALADILAAWSAGTDINSRINNVSGMVSQVADSDLDTLIGGGSGDWFASTGDFRSDFDASKDID